MTTAAVAEQAASVAASGRPRGRAHQHVAKPWGEEIVFHRRDGEVQKILRVRAGHRLSLQYHRRKRETLILLEGLAWLSVGPDAAHLRTDPLSQGLPVTIAPRTLHRISAPRGPAVLLEIATNAPDEGEDIVRLSDDYGRVSASARR